MRRTASRAARRWRAALLGLALALAAPSSLPTTEAAPRFARDTVCIVGPGMRRHRFDVELAVTAAQRAHGLMFRREMPADAGMLFLYPEPVAVRMWMKNTYLPLDMLFIDAAGEIVHIVPDTVPGSETVIEAGRDVPAVLELNAGVAAARGIRVGDRVLHERFGAPCG